MQNVFVENNDTTQNIHIEDSATIQYSIVVEDVADDNIIAELPVSGISNIVVDYTPGIEYDIVIQHAIQNVDELGLPIPDDDGQILAGDLDGDLYWVDQYTHPAYSSINRSANTGQVIDTFESDSQGHVTSLSLRYLQVADIPNLPISKITGLRTELDDRYTKTELQTSGEAEVHWDNLTNVPSSFNPTAHAMDSATYHTSSDTTILNATTSKHGFLPKLGGGTTNFLRADGTWAAPPSGGSSPLTTKGDLYTFSTVNARLPVGTNGHVLTADSSETTGVKWAVIGSGTFYYSVSSADFSTEEPYTDIVSINGARVSVGESGLLLIAPIHLPHGATVTSVIVRGDNTSKSWGLDRVDNGAITASNMAFTTLNTAVTSISYDTIDNEDYNYVLYVLSLNSGDEVYDATIKYTL